MSLPKLEFLRGSLDVLILKSLVWGPQHGYGITTFIRHQSDDALLIEEGTLYPALWRLESRGWLAGESQTIHTGRAKRLAQLRRRFQSLRRESRLCSGFQSPRR